jgi:hypothetical protein
MAFGPFKSLREVALTCQIGVHVEAFVESVPVRVDERFQDDLTFSLQNIAVRMSEASICEFLISPVLREVWRPYCDSLSIWSHVPFGAEDPLLGVPDYFFSRRSPLGLVQDQPYVLVVEAKKDDFDAGWAQCLAAMLAAQRMNDRPSRLVYGCVSNGPSWEFGKLDECSLTQEIRQFILSDLPGLFGAWNYVFTQAKEQALAPAA